MPLNISQLMWQSQKKERRGFSSKNGVVTVLSVMGKYEGSKVLDTETLTTFCAGCTQHDNDNTKLSTIAIHKLNCRINHTGSAGAMEAGGAVSIFTRSETLHSLRYTEYLGNGDSAAYKSVVKAALYGGASITKVECTGHIQKQMGKGLLTAIADNRSNIFIIDRTGRKLAKMIANKARGEKRVSGISGTSKLTKDR